MQILLEKKNNLHSRNFFLLQGSLPSSPRLSINTKVIDLSVSNRDNIVIDVSKVYDKNQAEGIKFHIPRTNKTRSPLPCKFSYLHNEYMMTVIIINPYIDKNIAKTNK